MCESKISFGLEPHFFQMGHHNRDVLFQKNGSGSLSIEAKHFIIKYYIEDWDKVGIKLKFFEQKLFLLFFKDIKSKIGILAF